MIPKYDKIAYTDNIPYPFLDEKWILVDSDGESWQLGLLSGVISVTPVRTDILTNYIVCRIDNKVYDLMENKYCGYRHSIFLKHAVGGYVAKKEKKKQLFLGKNRRVRSYIQLQK